MAPAVYRLFAAAACAVALVHADEACSEDELLLEEEGIADQNVQLLQINHDLESLEGRVSGGGSGMRRSSHESGNQLGKNMHTAAVVAAKHADKTMIKAEGSANKADEEKTSKEAADARKTKKTEKRDDASFLDYLEIGGSDGSCPSDYTRVGLGGCAALDGVQIEYRGVTEAVAWWGESCDTRWTPGPGCWINKNMRLRNTPDTCSEAAGQSGHSAICKWEEWTKIEVYYGNVYGQIHTRWYCDDATDQGVITVAECQVAADAAGYDFYHMNSINGMCSISQTCSQVSWDNSKTFDIHSRSKKWCRQDGGDPHILASDGGDYQTITCQWKANDYTTWLENQR